MLPGYRRYAQVNDAIGCWGLRGLAHARETRREVKADLTSDYQTQRPGSNYNPKIGWR